MSFNASLRRTAALAVLAAASAAAADAAMYKAKRAGGSRAEVAGEF